jgi:hypothetical protein
MRETMKIDANLLKPGYQTREKNGLYAEFHPDGQLAHLGYYINGQPQGWTLTLNPDQYQGRTERHDRTEYPYTDAILAAATDPEETQALQAEFVVWVERWIDQIYRETTHEQVCSFCEKTQAEVKTLIAGPTVYICNECVGLCHEILSAST